MSDWNAYDYDKTSVPLSTKPQGFDDVVSKFHSLTKEADALTSVIKQLKEEIIFAFPEEIGTVTREAGEFDVTMKRNEIWQWDVDAVEALVADQTIPPHVTRKYGVDKKKFLQLSDTDQAEFIHALTRKAGAPTITVEKKGIS